MYCDLLNRHQFLLAVVAAGAVAFAQTKKIVPSGYMYPIGAFLGVLLLVYLANNLLCGSVMEGMDHGEQSDSTESDEKSEDEPSEDEKEESETVESSMKEGDPPVASVESELFTNYKSTPMPWN